MQKQGSKLVVFASGGGGNFLALIKSQQRFDYSISMLVVDRMCGAIDKAKQNNIPYFLIERKGDKENFFKELNRVLPNDIDLIVLAGFMPILNDEFCRLWDGKIINTHPSLLPKYGGKGMYGVKVHEAVMKAGEKETGCTVHFVDKGVDTGKIILQAKISVNKEETPWELGGRVHKLENELLPEAVALLLNKSRLKQ